MKINPTDIQWNNDKNYFFINPIEKENIKNYNHKSLKKLTGHLFIHTSGTKYKKCVALSKKSFLHSAESVNDHLQVQKEDKWLISLPLFHVGGLSILARSFLSQSPCFIMKGKWSIKAFLSNVKEHQITLTSLVPAQLYDLVLHKAKAPDSLRVVIVGGGMLHKSLYDSAQKLNWPVLPSYGMTETASQIATAHISSLKEKGYPLLKVLKHCQIKICSNRAIAVKSPALFTGWWTVEHPDTLEKPFHNGWFITEDKGKLEGTMLKIFGRDYMCKINGENVSLYELEDILTKILIDQKIHLNYQLLYASHPRAENQIILTTSEQDLKLLDFIRNEFNSKVRPFEKIQNCYLVPNLPKGNLSKIQVSHLKKYLGFDNS